MRVSLGSNGGSASPHKVMYRLGILFVVMGAVLGVGGLVTAVTSHVPEMTLFSVVFLAIFCGIGGFFAKLGRDAMHADDAVLKEGASYLGKIYAHEPDYRVLMNGRPCVTLVVRYFELGQIREARVNTGESDATRFPLGATVSIRVQGDVAALVPGSVSGMRIEREDDLMNPDFDPSPQLSSVGVSCPNCGANITVPLGMSRFCPYCNTKVSVTADGRLVRSGS